MIDKISNLGVLLNSENQKLITGGFHKLKKKGDDGVCSQEECVMDVDCGDGCSCDEHPSGTYMNCRG